MGSLHLMPALDATSCPRSFCLVLGLARAFASAAGSTHTSISVSGHDTARSRSHANALSERERERERERKRERERERGEKESARWRAHEREAAAAACTRAFKIVRQCTGGAVRAASTFFSSCVSTRCRWSEGTEAWQHWLTPQWPAFTVRCTPRFRSPRLSAWQWGGNAIADRSVHRTIDWRMV